MVKAGGALKIPDKTGHFRTLGLGRPVEALRHCKKCLILSRGAARAPNRGGIHLSKNRPGLNARSGGTKNIAPLPIGRFGGGFVGVCLKIGGLGKFADFCG